MSIPQYLKDTQAELRHVAWPTRAQTIVYTVLVAAVSIFVAIYLGFFDYLFTTTLTRVIGGVPQENNPAIQIDTGTSAPGSIIISTGTPQQ